MEAVVRIAEAVDIQAEAVAAITAADDLDLPSAAPACLTGAGAAFFLRRCLQREGFVSRGAVKAWDRHLQQAKIDAQLCSMMD